MEGDGDGDGDGVRNVNCTETPRMENFGSVLWARLLYLGGPNRARASFLLISRVVLCNENCSASVFRYLGNVGSQAGWRR